jgi:hypothetical protein
MVDPQDCLDLGGQLRRRRLTVDSEGASQSRGRTGHLTRPGTGSAKRAVRPWAVTRFTTAVGTTDRYWRADHAYQPLIASRRADTPGDTCETR